jgi:hypothetical protein
MTTPTIGATAFASTASDKVGSFKLATQEFYRIEAIIPVAKRQQRQLLRRARERHLLKSL